MDGKFQGVILKTIDYKDADKLASIFTFEHGKLTAKFSGVKKDKAKFKAVAQPFTLANFVIAKSGNNAVVTSVDTLDMFVGISQNFNKTICGFCVLDVLNSILPTEKKEEELFVFTIQALKNIETKNEHLSLISFLIKFLSITGFQLNLNLKNHVYLNKTSGNFVEEKEPQEVFEEIDLKVYHLLQLVDARNPVEFNLTQAKQAIRLLKTIIEINHQTQLKSFDFI